MSSTSSVASGLNITGFASDIDWQQLATDISSAQKTAQTTPLTEKKSIQLSKLTAWQSFNTTLSAVTSFVSANKLNSPVGYESYAASLTAADSSVVPSDVLSVSVGKGTLAAGSYTVEVSQLAEAEKISSGTFSSASSALGIEGALLINGKPVTVASTDTLTSIAKKMNNAGAGVTASILNISATDHRLMLQSGREGVAGMSLDVSGTVNLLQALGLTDQSLLHASSTDAESAKYADGETAIGTLLGLASPQTGSIRITGTDDVSQTVSIDLATHSLQDIADNINLAGLVGVTASVEEIVEDTGTTYKLKLTNIDASDLVDDSNVLHAMGVLGETAKNVLQVGLDAKLKVDGYDVTSSSNTLTGVINGITLKLTGTNESKPITLDIAQDNSGLSTTVSTLVSNLNDALKYIKDQNTFSSSDSAAKPLIGDISLSTIKRTISNILLTIIEGNDTYETAKSIGISFGADGAISLDADKFAAALADEPDEVINAIKTLGTDFYNKLNVYVDATTGTIKSITDSINQNIDRIDDQLERIEARCDAQAKLLQRRFTALQVLLAQSSKTQDWLTAQVDAMTKSNS